MKTYLCKFNGRTRGAIGIFYMIYTNISLENPETEPDKLKHQIEMKLYEKYEHIIFLEYSEVKQ